MARNNMVLKPFKAPSRYNIGFGFYDQPQLLNRLG